MINKIQAHMVFEHPTSKILVVYKLWSHMELTTRGPSCKVLKQQFVRQVPIFLLLSELKVDIIFFEKGQKFAHLTQLSTTILLRNEINSFLKLVLKVLGQRFSSYKLKCDLSNLIIFLFGIGSFSFLLPFQISRYC